jgi:hypothetical protein
VYAPALSRNLLTQLSIDAATRGYRLETREVSSNEASLRVDVTDAAVSGYDLIFVRRPSASVALTGALVRGGTVTRACSVQGESTSTTLYAFDRQLNAALRRALEDASAKLFQCLRL